MPGEFKIKNGLIVNNTIAITGIVDMLSNRADQLLTNSALYSNLESLSSQLSANYDDSVIDYTPSISGYTQVSNTISGHLNGISNRLSGGFYTGIVTFEDGIVMTISGGLIADVTQPV